MHIILYYIILYLYYMSYVYCYDPCLGAARPPWLPLSGHPEVSQGARGLCQEGTEGGVQGGAGGQLLPRARAG